MGIIAWIVFGLIVGVIANFIDPRPAKGGIVGAAVLGVIGAVVGGFLSSLFLGVGITGFNLSSIVIAVAIVTKLIGCGLPAMLFLRNKSKAMIVGIGMISRGEVGLIVAGIGVTSGVLSSNIYTTIIIMVAITTLVTPMWLKKAYSKEKELVDTN